jgi:hypothetical protein
MCSNLSMVSDIFDGSSVRSVGSRFSVVVPALRVWASMAATATAWYLGGEL